MVECDLAKVEVAGSNPVSRFTISDLAAIVGRLFHFSTCVENVSSGDIDYSARLCAFITRRMRVAIEKSLTAINTITDTPALI